MPCRSRFQPVLLLMFFLLLGCAPASSSPEPAPVLTATPALVPTDTQPATSNLTPDTSSPNTSWWRPAPGLTWQWQLGNDDIDTSIDADVFDVDLYVDQAIIDELHAKGKKAICYISVGSWEDWRPDAEQFPPEVLGKDYEGWPGEKWLDIRRIDLLAPIMLARLDRCAAKGFDGVEPDNMQIWDNDTGFPLTYADQLQYALWLAEQAHQRGLAIGQKNAPDMVADLVDVYDFAITEDAFYYGWAEAMQPYIAAHKPVFAAEYTDLPGDFAAFCRQSKALGFSTILKKRDLDAWLETCE
ncbi:MAG: endo alpha-1,4 polygalactosaminidase [Anaerolineae bacterium]|nr:MAG: endo alpha-1,4 polygalactosaminidase [Anaerolineae bacterium]